VGGHDEVEEIPIDHDGTITLDMIALFGYESIIKVVKCRALFASERLSISRWPKTSRRDPSKTLMSDSHITYGTSQLQDILILMFHLPLGTSNGPLSTVD
jgi:hypothetical protein